MNHSFNTDYAELYGIEEAIILENIAFWIKKNESNGTNFYDDYTWTYNSAESFNKLFPYITPSKIRRCLLKLEELNVLKSGNYNKAGYDKTKWYTICNVEVSTFYKLKNGLYNLENGHYKMKNRIEQIVEPIPDINTNINTVIKSIKKETNFDIMIKEFTNNKELQTTIYDFIKMRKTIKKPITDKALTLTLNKLIKISLNEQMQIDVLNQSILNCWQGIFEIKEENFKQKTFDIKSKNKIATLEEMKGW